MTVAPHDAVIAIMLCLLSMDASAQSALDRVDPSRAEQIDERDKPRGSEDLRVSAPTPNPAPKTDTLEIHVSSIRITGLTALRQSDFASIVGEYLGRTLSGGDLSELADKVAKRARDKGYPFATAQIVPQTLASGSLKVIIDEGAIDEVRINGIDDEALKHALSSIVSGHPMPLAQIERRILLARDLPGVVIRNARLRIEGDRRILVIDAMRDRVSGWASVDNHGTRTLGPVAASMGINVNGVFSANDALQIAVYNTVFQPSELTFGRVRYSERIHTSGTELSLAVAWSRSQPGAYLRRAEIDGESRWGSISLAQPLLRRRASSIWLNISLDNREVTQSRSDTLVRQDRLTVARAGLYANTLAFEGQLRANAVISRGLDIFDATSAGEPTSSRFAASGAFTTLAGWLNWVSPRIHNFAFEISGSGQVASGPLLLSEEIGLGGDRFLKAYDYNERSGDQGIAGSVEVRYELDDFFAPGRGGQLYTYVDGGAVWNQSLPDSAGSLASSGFGVRAALLPRMNAHMELAIPLSGDRFDTGDVSPRLRFGLSQGF